MPLCSIKNGGDTTKINCHEGQTVHSFLTVNKIYLDAPCAGRGVCGKCAVRISGEFSPAGDAEKKLLGSKINDGFRLACHTFILGDCAIELDESTYAIKTDIESETQLYPSPYTKKFAKQNCAAVGMAADIGTTTVAVFFYNLITGRHLYTASCLNPQKAFGADVMSRIELCVNDSENVKILHGIIINALNVLANEFSQNTDIKKEFICDCVIAGNTTMQLLAHGLDPASLGASPFIPQSLFGCEVKSRDIGLNIPGNTYFMPAIGGFLGGDITACLLSRDFDRIKHDAFLIDIGTNGEMALLSSGKIIACSTAAGPAFEGAKIRFGTGSINGAIKSFKLEDGLKTETIGNAPPRGICGSGLIDAAAEFVRERLIDETGRIDEDYEGSYKNLICDTQDGLSLALTEDKSIYLTSRDIRELQLAKAAIRAGAITLLKSADSESAAGFIAGGFGSAINLKSAAVLGLLPKELSFNAQAIGNAAGSGAVKCLLSRKNRTRAQKIADNVQVIDLSVNKIFEEEFIEGMMF